MNKPRKDTFDMTKKSMLKIFRDTARVRMGGTASELEAARYIQELCASFGGEAVIEPFAVQMGDDISATLTVDGASIPCKGYMCCGTGEISAPLYYLRATDKYSLSECKDKIVLIDGYLGRWVYKDMLDNGALAFITYDGHINYSDRDIDQRELRAMVVADDKKLLGVNINAKDAVKLIKNDAKEAAITVSQNEYEGESRNVVLTLPGETDETIVFTAHYDSTSLSQGAYDNMSGSVGILAVAEHFAKVSHKRTLKFVWCGSEERGLLGSKAYVKAHEEELEKSALNINLDMIGTYMGKFIACVSAENKLSHYISYMAAEVGFPVSSKTGVYSSDSTPFADKGVPAVSFARIAGGNVAPIHCRYDLMDVMSMEQLEKDIEFLTLFTERFANAVVCPVSREIPEDIKKQLDEYLFRKRKEQ